MTTDARTPDEVEQDRLGRAAEFAEESGEAWAEESRPGSFGCHELLDRTSLVADLLDKYILDHPACVANPAWYRMAEKAAAALWELYQQVGAEHLSAEAVDRKAVDAPA